VGDQRAAVRGPRVRGIRSVGDRRERTLKAILLWMACTILTGGLLCLVSLGGPTRSLPMKPSAASRLLRAYATQMDTLRRLKNGGSQFVRETAPARRLRGWRSDRQEKVTNARYAL
jgi:hypothetical protein